MDIKNIKAVLFDFGGTIDYDGIDWKNRINNFFLENKIPVEKSKVFEASGHAMKMLDKDKSSKNLSYKQTVDVYIYWIIKNLSIIIEDYKKNVVDPFYSSSLEIINKNKKLLEKMSQKYLLGIVSNNFGNCEGWCREFGIEKYFKIIVDSAAAGMQKPDKEIFISACNKLKVKPQEAAFIGDKFEIDIISPKELGMLPIWINNSEPDDSHKDAVRIRKLEELTKIFDIKDEIKLLI